MTISGIVTNIQRCSTEDGPGIRTTAFLKGCPLSCIWCHNIETINPNPQIVWYGVKCIGDQACIEACPNDVLELTKDGMLINREKCEVCGACEDACPTGAMKLMGQKWNAKDLVQELIRDKIFFTTSGGGVTLSGGEPTYQPDFVIEVAKGLKKEDVHVALDTCGYCSQKILEKILPHVDLVLYDLKLMDSEKHLEFTGVPIQLILENARIITEKKVPVWIRTPIIPKHTDFEDNIHAISRFIIENMPTVERYDLLAFNKMCIDKYSLFGLEYPLKDEELIRKETMEGLAAIAREEGIYKVVWSGMTRREKEEGSTTNTRMEVDRCG
jgi:pyruvate formate lyase activating enzyme